MDLHLTRNIAAFATAALLAGCSLANGVPSSPIGSGTTASSALSGDLLYVSSGSSARGVDILTFPQGKHVAKISNIGTPYGMCADSHGNVWIDAYAGNQIWALYEFTHGSTHWSLTRRSRREWDSCAIDPTTANVAVVGVAGAGTGIVEVLRPSLKGGAKIFDTSFSPFAAAYDDRGNLYVDGGFGSENEFAFAQMPKGTRKLNYVRLDAPAVWAAGNVAFDGKYVTVGVATRSSGHSVIYRVQVSGKRGTVVGTVKPDDLSESPRYAISGSKVAATIRGYNARRIGLYDYPAGGRRTDQYRGFDNVLFVTISTGPH